MEKISLTESPFMCLSHLDKIKWKELHWLPPYDVAVFDLGLSVAMSQVTGRGLRSPPKMLSSLPITASFRKVSSVRVCVRAFVLLHHILQPHSSHR